MRDGNGNRVKPGNHSDDLCMMSINEHCDGGALEGMEGGMCRTNLGRRLLQVSDDDVVESCAAKEILVRGRNVGGEDMWIGSGITNAKVINPSAPEAATESRNRSEPRKTGKRTRKVAPEYHGVDKEIGHLLISPQKGSQISTSSSISSGIEVWADNTFDTATSNSLHACEHFLSPTSISTSTSTKTTSIHENSSSTSLDPSEPPNKTKKGRKNYRGGQKLRVWKARKVAAAVLAKETVVAVNGVVDGDGDPESVIAGSSDIEEQREEHYGGVFVDPERRGAESTKRIGKGLDGAFTERVSDKPKNASRGESRQTTVKKAEKKEGGIPAMGPLPRGVLPYPFKPAAISKEEKSNRISSSEGEPQTRRPLPPGILPYPFPTKSSITEQNPGRRIINKEENSKRVSSSETGSRARKSLPRGILSYPFPTKAATAKQDPGPGGRITNKEKNINRTSPSQADHTAGSQVRKCLPRGILPFPFSTKTTTTKQGPGRSISTASSKMRLDEPLTKLAKRPLPRGVLPYPFPTKAPTTNQDPGQQRPTNDKTSFKETLTKPSKRRLPPGILPHPYPPPAPSPKPASNPY